MRLRHCALLAVLLLPAGVTRAAGEPVDGHPSPEERALLVLTGAVRQDPQAWCERCEDDCAVYPSEGLAPLGWDLRLGRAARFHARHMHETPCFQHDACCELGVSGGEVACVAPASSGCAACGTTSCPGSTPWDRMRLFGYEAGSAENIAAGRTGVEATVCQWLRSPGHRTNLLGARHRDLGTGHFAGADGCYPAYWVQAFGTAGSEPGPLVAGALVDGTFFAAVWHADAPPAEARVVVDGVCRDLSPTWGAGPSATWTADAELGAGCHSYVFAFTDPAGAVHRRPETGAYLTGAGCDGAYSEEAPAADCLEADGEAGGGGGAGCAGAPGGSGWAALILAALFLSRRTRCASCTR